MARDIVAPKSYQTLIGAYSPNGAEVQGLHILDTNDSANFYGMFVIYNGAPERAQFVIEHLRRRFNVYSDVFQNKEIAKPKAFFQELLADLMREMQKHGVHMADGESFGAVMVKEGRAIIGRIHGCPIFYLREHKFRTVFPSAGAGANKLEVEAVPVSDGDKILICSHDMVRRVTKQELRNIIHSKPNLDEACARITELANRYEEVRAPHIALIHFKRNREPSKALLNSRNLLVIGGIALLIMGLVFSRELTSFVRFNLSPRLVKRIQTVSSSLTGGASKRKNQPDLLYEFETVFDGMSVPYDIAIGSDGTYYVVDDKESQVIRYDPFAKRTTLLGNGLNLIFPTGIEVIGDKLYITDFSSSASELYIMKTDGTLIRGLKSVNKPGVGPLRNPKAMAVDRDSNLWLADRTNNRLLKFNENGDYLGKIQCNAAFSSPNGISAGRDGLIYVTFKDTNNIAVIGNNGTLKAFKVFSGEGTSKRALTFDQPSGIAVDNKGFVYIADRQNNRIVVADSHGRQDVILDKKQNKDFAHYMPFGLKLGPKGKYIYIVGSAALSYDNTCQFESDKCRGKVWRMRIE